MQQYVAVLIPVYNDWQSVKVLIGEVNKQCALLPDKKITFLIVNDCSTEFTYTHHLQGEDSPEDVRFVDLVKNVEQAHVNICMVKPRMKFIKQCNRCCRIIP